jgi:GWxTD domain-containing protein
MALTSVAVSPVLADEAFPRTGPEALAAYESNAERWLDGPVQYIVLAEEREAFRALETTAEREVFIEWFWARRDNDLRDEGNPYKAEFYDRVAASNKRYHDFPRGWKSDRGQVHITLGRPDGIRPRLGGNAEAAVWTYYTVGPRANQRDFGTVLGEMTIAFVKSDRRAGYRIYGGFGGPGVLPLYVRDAFRFTREAAIVDSTLTLAVN